MKKKLLWFLVIMCISVLVLPVSQASAKENRSLINKNSKCQSNNDKALKNNLDQSYKLYQELDYYIFLNSNDVYVFDEEKARNDKMSEFNILTGQQLTTIKNDEKNYGEKSVYDNTVAEKQNMDQRSFAFTMWNYCGPGNHGGTPKNGIDKICKVHDDCYTREGWGSCSCDKAIADSMGYAAANSKYTAFQRSFAAAAAGHFTQRYYTRMCKWW